MTPQLVEIKGEDFVEKVRYCRTFDECANTNLEAVFDLILQAAAENHVPQAAAGYILPDLVFWNVDSRHEQQPVKENDRGVALVSGNSPRIFSMVMDGELNPYDFMLSVIDTERYAPIAA